MAVEIRPVRIEGDVAYVALNRGFEVIIDAVDVPLVGGVNWRVTPDKHNFYARRNVSVGGNGKQYSVSMHRVIMDAKPGDIVDHINGNGLDNRRSNLRIATNSQNTCNARLSARNKSGFKGVSWSQQTKKWHARIGSHGAKVHLGFYANVEDAAAAYAAASAELHGEFRRLS